MLERWWCENGSELCFDAGAAQSPPAPVLDDGIAISQMSIALTVDRTDVPIYRAMRAVVRPRRGHWIVAPK